MTISSDAGIGKATHYLPRHQLEISVTITHRQSVTDTHDTHNVTDTHDTHTLPATLYRHVTQTQTLPQHCR